MSDQPPPLIEERLESLLSQYPPKATPPEQFWGAQFDHGLAWVRFPEGCGGLDQDQRWQTYVEDRIAEAGGSTANRETNVIGLAMAAPTLVGHAPTDLQHRLLRPLFNSSEIWCQLFSEPGAGSDLAGLATSAVRDGADWVINGQKVWTTLAHRARWGLLLARTDPNVPKHRGLTYFVLDMSAPGVEIRPLYELTGEAEFNEVYLENVRVPDTHRLGEEGSGWSVALTTLMNERASAGRDIGARGSGSIATAMELWKAGGGGNNPVRRYQLARFWAAAEVLRLTELRAAASAGRGTPGPEGSVAKLRWSELNQAITNFSLDLLGAAGMTYPGGYQFVRPDSSQVHSGIPQKAFLRARANSIEGGTSQIMRTILGDRVLRLPAEPRDDRSKPWKEIPRQ
jgi:alkylation response protein AidB-like acyl-CoA dehydrogenase